VGRNTKSQESTFLAQPTKQLFCLPLCDSRRELTRVLPVSGSGMSIAAAMLAASVDFFFFFFSLLGAVTAVVSGV